MSLLSLSSSQTRTSSLLFDIPHSTGPPQSLVEDISYCIVISSFTFFHLYPLDTSLSVSRNTNSVRLKLRCFICAGTDRAIKSRQRSGISRLAKQHPCALCDTRIAPLSHFDCLFPLLHPISGSPCWCRIRGMPSSYPHPCPPPFTQP